MRGGEGRMWGVEDGRIEFGERKRGRIELDFGIERGFEVGN